MRINGRAVWNAALVVLMIGSAHPAVARAQGGIGYVSGGPVAVRSLGIRDFAWQAGGGGEMLNGPLGVGAEVGWVYFPEVTKTFDQGRGVSSSPAATGVALSVNTSFHFGSVVVDRRTRPFMTAGLTLLLGGESLPLLHVAGGVDWWATRRTGLRFEVREQYPVMMAFRFGLVFR